MGFRKFPAIDIDKVNRNKRNQDHMGIQLVASRISGQRAQENNPQKSGESDEHQKVATAPRGFTLFLGRLDANI